MEHMIQLHIEKLPEGVYLATSDELQGLVAQGRTIQETIEIARDVARKLIEAQSDPSTAPLPPAREAFDYPALNRYTMISSNGTADRLEARWRDGQPVGVISRYRPRCGGHCCEPCSKRISSMRLALGRTR